MASERTLVCPWAASRVAVKCSCEFSGYAMSEDIRRRIKSLVSPYGQVIEIMRREIARLAV
jgi:hypothetical protein